MQDCEHLLTEDEKNRNKHGPMYQYDCVNTIVENKDKEDTNSQPIYTVKELTRKDVCYFWF